MSGHAMDWTDEIYPIWTVAGISERIAVGGRHAGPDLPEWTVVLPSADLARVLIHEARHRARGEVSRLITREVSR